MSSFLLALVLVVAVAAAHAIEVNGRIKGTVTDPSGAVVPGVAVVATNMATGVKFNTKTQADGAYLFPQLPVGTYSISVVAPGFKAFTATGIIINIDQEYVETVKLEVGNTSETLEVAADAVQVNTTDMQLGNIVNSKQMVELPLINRTFTGLELIEPGVQAASDRFTGNYSASGSQSQQSEYLINGADTNDISLNTLTYTPNLDAIDQFNLIEGPLNAEYDRNSGGIVSATLKQGTNHIHGDVFEFYRDTFLNTNNYLQKSFNSAGQRTDTVAKYHQNIFGITIGGPIIRDKLFLFYAYQGTRQVVPESGGTVSVFTQNNLNGNFSEDLTPQSSHFNYVFSGQKIPGTFTALSALNPACIPNGTNTWGATKTTVGCLTALGGVIPTSAFNPVSLKLAQAYVPLPNNSGTSPYSYIFHPVVTTKANQDLARMDYAISPKNQLTLIGVYNRSSAPETLPFTGATLPGFGDVSTSYTQQYTLDDVQQFNSTLVNEFAAHWTRFNYQAVLPQVPTQPSSAGFSINPQNTAGAGLPTIAVGNFFTLGFSTNGPQPRIDQVYQLGDNISKVVRQHALKFGYDGRRFNVSNPFSARNNGSYSFSNSTSTSPYTTGDSSLDFLLGIPGTYSQGSGATIQAQAYLNYLYGQDSWKITNTLTLDYGLGYSIDTPLQQHQYQGEAVLCLIGGQQSTVFPTAPKGLNYPGDKGCNSAGGAVLHLGELAPRLGFAWSPTNWGWLSGTSHQFAIRGGFGFYYDRTEEESSLETLTTPPFGLSSAGVNDYAPAGTTLTPAFVNPYEDINSGTTYTNKFPYTFPAPGAAINWAKLEPVAKSTYAPGFRAPYAENFQLTLEREFASRVVARLSYVGSLARRNQVDFEGNYETAAGHAACLAATTTCSAYTANGTLPIAGTNATNQQKNFPQNTAWGAIDPNTGLTGFTSIGEDSSEGSSSYNALQASVVKAYTHGLTFQLSYTFSHALDNGSSFEGSGFGGTNGRGYNQYFPSLNYGNSSYDARQRLVFAPIYTTPILHSANWYSPLNLAASGWQISGITTLATGFPYDFTLSGSNSLWCSSANSFYACPDIPVQVGPLQTANPRTAARLNGLPVWYTNTSASFTEEPIGQFGNVSRNKYHGPGINNTNLILAKNFNLSADGVRRLQLRMESDNVFNHTQFNNPTAALSNTFSTVTNSFSGSPGTISSAASARQTQLAAKFYF
ncbi:MAG TPA: carboxypeptidase-like regulatory domain-containing protein [Candidatus Aquilonibacter sp.]|nr:carboxypeptidase-like regulatory domain-containing protein [Candidatus Aquilonibacter sp.]